MYETLRYRRQFILTRDSKSTLSEWQCVRIKEYYFYAHPDIYITSLMDSEKSLVLLGSIFDPADPEMENERILTNIHASVNSIEDLFLYVKKYAGSYALFYISENDEIIFNDPLSLREIYYCTENNQIVCGSQPNIVANYSTPEIKPNRDPKFLEYYTKHLKNSRWDPDCKWIGDTTFYEGVLHLLPNHYLDIKQRTSRRYWPNEPIKRLGLEDAVSKSCDFLQGSIRAIAHRHPIMMAVTSGTDSRTLMAASKGIEDKIYYFINNQSVGHLHPDITVPKNMFEILEIPFHVHDVPMDVDAQFRRIFLNNTFFASDRILPTIYNVYYKNLSEKVNILGIGEIGRTRYGKEPRKLNSYRMAYKLGYKDGQYAIERAEQILSELLPVARAFDLNVLTLLYWEHTMGNWGSTGNSESDIAIEELNPYDSHLLYEIFLGVEDQYTRYNNPVIFKEMIRKMWPQLLKWPINSPYTRRDILLKPFKKYGTYDILKEMKYQLCYLRHLCKKIL